MFVLELFGGLGSGEEILTPGAKFKYRCRSEFASRISWAIWSLLRRSVMLHSSLQGIVSYELGCFILNVFAFPSSQNGFIIFKGH